MASQAEPAPMQRGTLFPGEMQLVRFGAAGQLPGYVAGEAKDPAVIVLQEWWGVVPSCVDHALRIASKGYRVMVPDLYKGKVGVDKEEASHLLSKLDWVAAVDEIKQAVQYLREGGASKVGCAGFCMGGALTLAAAQHAGIDCAAAFYGIPGPEICQPSNIKVPIQQHHGELDDAKGFSDPESAKAFAEKVNAAGGKSEVFVYPGVGHGFMNKGGKSTELRAHMNFPEPPTDAERDLAWERVFQLFEAQLKGGK